MKLADGKEFEMGMDLFYPASNQRFPLKLMTNPARHIVCTTAEGPSLAVIPQATSSEGLVESSAIALSRFYSTLEGALDALAQELNRNSSKIAVEIQKLRDESFKNGFLTFKIRNIAAQVGSGKMTFTEAESEYTKALGSEVIMRAEETTPTTATMPIITGFSTPKKRREPKPAAKSVESIITG